MGKAATLKNGTVLADKYKIRKLLLHNNNSITYEAREIATDELVAIREYMPSDLVVRLEGDEDVIIENKGDKRQRFDAGVNEFIAEAKMLAKNKMVDGLLKVRDCFKTNNTVYMVTEPFAGSNLTTLVSSTGYMKYDEAENIFIDIIVLLKQMASMGIYHNSITPDRILVMNDGSFRIIEFSASETVEGFSPEEKYYRHQKNQENLMVYSLAATMYFAITGIIPNDAKARARKDELKTPKAYNKKIKKSDANAILNAMAVNYQIRTVTLEDFQKELLMNNVAVAKVKEERESVNIGRIIKTVAGLLLLAAIVTGIVLVANGTIKLNFMKFLTGGGEGPTKNVNTEQLVEVESISFLNREVSIDLVPKAISISETSIILENVSDTKDLTISIDEYAPQTAEIKIVFSPYDASDKNVKYSSADASIAEVKDGKIYGYKAGVTTITAVTNNGKKATTTVTVKENASVTWKSTNQTVASVSSGVVTALSKGNTVISCVSDSDSTVLAECEVLVGKPPQANTITSSTANAAGVQIKVNWGTSAYERYANSSPVMHTGNGTAAPSSGNNQWATGNWYNGMTSIGGTAFEITNMNEIKEYINSLGANAKITSIEFIANRKDSGGKEKANVKLYSTIKTVATYSKEGSITTYYGATELESKSWMWGEEWTYSITEKADIDKYLNGTNKGFLVYGWGQDGYSIISGVEIKINYTVEE